MRTGNDHGIAEALTLRDLVRHIRLHEQRQQIPAPRLLLTRRNRALRILQELHADAVHRASPGGEPFRFGLSGRK
jgi:hypothetical protein